MSQIFETKCSCGEPISIEIGARLTFRKDKKRPFYPDENHCEEWGLDAGEYPLDGVTAFRCRRCDGFLADTVPGAEFEQQESRSHQ